MPSPVAAFLYTNNLIIHTVFAIVLTLLLSLFKIPALFLYGLHTYIHPDDVNPSGSSNGIKAAIRRPGVTDSELLKPRRRSKERYEFDESKAQIFRLKLTEAHLQTRIYFKEFYGVFNFTITALSSLLLHRFLRKGKDDGIVKNGTIIPLLLGLVAICRVLFLVFKTGFERSASKRSEKQLSFIWGFMGFVSCLTIVFEVVPNRVFDVSFESLHGLSKFFIAAFMGVTASLLYIPSLRNARAFWLGTDQIRCNLAIISCGWFSRQLLYANYLAVIFTSLLWIRPLAEFLVKTDVNGKTAEKGREVVELVGYVGMTRISFEAFRQWCLLITGLSQVLTLRSNVQMFLNEAVLCWYQRLHASKVPDLDYSRAKVFLHNHYLCLVVLQFLAPAVVILLLLGLSPFDHNLIADKEWVCEQSSCSAFAKEVTLFVAWWIVFVWALFNSALLALYRRGILYVL